MVIFGTAEGYAPDLVSYVRLLQWKHDLNADADAWAVLTLPIFARDAPSFQRVGSAPWISTLIPIHHIYVYLPHLRTCICDGKTIPIYSNGGDVLA